MATVLPFPSRFPSSRLPAPLKEASPSVAEAAGTDSLTSLTSVADFIALASKGPAPAKAKTLAFPARATSEDGAAASKPKKKRVLKLELIFDSKGTGSAKAWAVRGFFKDAPVQLDDGMEMGLLAFVLNASAIETPPGTLDLPAGARLTPSKSMHSFGETPWSETDDRAVAWQFIHRMQVAWQSCVNAKKERLDVREMWAKRLEELLPKIEPSLVVNDKLERAPAYRDDGMPLSAKAIERAAQHARMVKEIQQGYSAGVLDCSALFEHIVPVVENSGDEVTNESTLWITQPAKVALAKFRADFCLQPEDPQTWGEVLALTQYCDFLHSMAYAPPFLSDAEKAAWLRSNLRMIERTSTNFAPALAAYMARNSAELALINRTTMRFSELAKRLNSDNEMTFEKR